MGKGWVVCEHVDALLVLIKIQKLVKIVAYNNLGCRCQGQEKEIPVV